jgi:hypothetical protein
MNLSTHSFVSSPVSRREALKRAAAVLGIAIAPSLLSNVLRAQSSTALRRYLDEDQFATITALAERILPRTDTPGALDVGVPAFIDLMYGEYFSAGEKQRLVAALAAFDAAATSAHGKGFAQLTGEQQDAQLMATAESSSERQHFVGIRELTIVGYFTSEVVGRNVLIYDPIPTRYEGCIPLEETGNVSWTLR